MTTAGDNESVRVVHLLGSLDRGGVELRTLDLIRSLDSTVVSYMLTLSGRSGSMANDYTTSGAHVVPLAIHSVLFPFRFIRFLRREGITAVHSHVHHSSGYLLALAWIAGIQIRIAHFRSDGIRMSAMSLPTKIKTWILKMLLRTFATRIVGVSPDSLSLGWDSEWSHDPRCSVLVNGFNLDRFKVNEGAKVRSGLSDISGPVILHLGRADSPTKNREGALDIFAHFCEQNELGTLVFVGRDGANESQEAANRHRWSLQINQQNMAERVIFLGERDDVVDILHSADVLLFTSQLEGLPGVLVEARCAGLPVVSSDLPGCRFLASKLPGIKIISAQDPIATWVSALEKSLIDSPTSATRSKSLDDMVGTDFDMASALKLYRELWTKSASGKSN